MLHRKEFLKQDEIIKYKTDSNEEFVFIRNNQDNDKHVWVINPQSLD